MQTKKQMRIPDTVNGDQPKSPKRSQWPGSCLLVSGKSSKTLSHSHHSRNIRRNSTSFLAFSSALHKVCDKFFSSWYISTHLSFITSFTATIPNFTWIDRSYSHHRLLWVHTESSLAVPLNIAGMRFQQLGSTHRQLSANKRTRAKAINPISFSVTNSIHPIYQVLLNLAPINTLALMKKSNKG